MASRKDELNKAKETGKSIVAKQTEEKPAVPNKEEKPKKEQSLVANKFGTKKEKTWNDVKSEYNNDPVKIADYLNNAKDYTPGNLTEKGMEEFGYSKGEDGKWAPKPKTTTPTTETKTTTPTTEVPTTDTASSATTNATTDSTISELEKLMAGNEKLKKQIEDLQKSDGSIDKDEAKSAWDKHMQKGLEIGAVTFDKDGNYVLTNVNKKGWEDWATMLSAGASVIGLAMGVPIIPINFRKITNKDKKDKAIREFQKQLTDISAGNLGKVEDVKSSAEAGKVAKANEEDINAYSKYKEDVGAYEAKSDIDTSSEKELIDAQTQSRLEELQAQQLNSEALLKLEQAHDKEMAKLSSDLSTASAKELTAYSKTGWVIDYVKELRAQGLDDKDIALAIAGLNGETPTQMGLKNAEVIVGMVTDTANTVLDHIPFLGKKKKK